VLPCEPTRPAARPIGASKRQICELLPYVPAVARRYANAGTELDDLVAAGNLGLVEAGLRFDPQRRVKFVTYADWWIRKAILETLGESSGPMRLPRHQRDRLRQLRQARDDWVATRGEEPSLHQLAETTGLAPKLVHRLLQLRKPSLSLEQPTGADGGKPLGELLEDSRRETPQGSLVRRDLARRVRRCIEKLGPRQRAILTHRFGLNDEPPMTLRETGEALGLSRERVRQIEFRALLTLKHTF